MRRLALRRFPDEVVRKRQGQGAFNQYGEYETAGPVETVFPGAGFAAVFDGFRFCWRCVSGRTPQGFLCRTALRGSGAKATR